MHIADKVTSADFEKVCDTCATNATALPSFCLYLQEVRESIAQRQFSDFISNNSPFGELDLCVHDAKYMEVMSGIAEKMGPDDSIEHRQHLLHLLQFYVEELEPSMALLTNGSFGSS